MFRRSHPRSPKQPVAQCVECYNVKVRLAMGTLLCAALIFFSAAALLPNRPPRRPPQSTMLKPNAKKTSPVTV